MENRPGKGLGEALEVGTAEEEEGEGGSVETEIAYAGWALTARLA